MKKVTKIFMAALLVGICSFGYAQYEWKNPPKPSEVIIGTVEKSYYGGEERIYRLGKKGNKLGTDSDTRQERPLKSDEFYYSELLDIARKKYGETYPKFTLRSFKYEVKGNTYDYNWRDYIEYSRAFVFSAVVVITTPEAEANENLSQAIDKAFRNVRQGSRIAIDQVTVWSGIDREDYKDQLIDVLLDKGYKVVAKEYLEKLYEEQQGQQSGIYNDKTTVQENNFSAVGYYINVKVTETSLRVQVVNVSTGEYEGNATVNF